MLVALGLRAMRRALLLGRAAHLPSGWTEHGDHVHTAGLPHVHLRGHAMALRPLLVGVVHGTTPGSGALTAAVFAELPTTEGRLLAITCFGLGSRRGNVGRERPLGGSAAPAAGSPRIAAGLLLGIGVTSTGLGVTWGLAAAAALGAR